MTSKYRDYSTQWLKWRRACLKEQIKNITAELKERKETKYEPLVCCPKCGGCLIKETLVRLTCLNCGHREIIKDLDNDK